MTDQVTIKKPFDAHVHLRQGAMLRAVAPITATKFHAAIAMPNTDPPIETLDQAIAYQREIIAACQGDALTLGFEPLMTLYLTRNLTAAEIERSAVGSEGVKIYAVKYYPWGATTNSQWGYLNILDAKEVLKEMERVGLPLLLHGEVHDVNPYEGEQAFVKNVLPQLLEIYPDLKISLEHLSSAEGADFIEKNGKENSLVATVTPHHLMYSRDDAESEPLLRCKPLIKSTRDRDAIRALVAKELPFVFAGSDSAPHAESKKMSGAYGVFSAPVAVELYTQIFEELRALDRLENFVSVNGPHFYGLEPDEQTVALVKKDWKFTEPVVTDEREKVWSLGSSPHGSQTIHWQIYS